MTVDFERVEARGLVKMYGSTRALAGVTAAFEPSCVTVVEGPNGSGKTTLLGVLSTLVRPTRGEVRYGEHVSAAAARGRIGLLAHAAMVYPDLSGRENLMLFARLSSVIDERRRISELVERFEIGAWLDRPARTYSRGQLQRVALARAVVHAPRLLLLDEPSTGLDARSVERLVTVVEEERARGTIVVLVTHDAAFADRLADRRVRLERGRVAEAGSPS